MADRRIGQGAHGKEWSRKAGRLTVPEPWPLWQVSVEQALHYQVSGNLIRRDPRARSNRYPNWALRNKVNEIVREACAAVLRLQPYEQGRPVR